MNKKYLIVLLSLLGLFATGSPNIVDSAWAASAEIPASCVQVLSGEADINCAKAFILQAIRGTAISRGLMWRAEGLFGAALIPQKPEGAMHMGLGYTSLFESALTTGTEVKAVKAAHGFYSPLFNSFSRFQTESVIAQREYYLVLIGKSLHGRFSYKEDGMAGFNLTPDPKYEDVTKINDYLDSAYALYKKMQAKGFNDNTLGDFIGIARAVQNFDGVETNNLMLLPFAQQVYDDAIAATIAEVRTGRNYGWVLSTQMKDRRLSAEDVIMAPEDEDQMAALVKIISEDFEYLVKLATKK